MRIRLIGVLCILAGIGVLVVANAQSMEERVYVYPPGAIVEAYPGTAPSTASDSQMIVDGCAVPHETVQIEVSEYEAKRLREEAGYPSEGVSGGILVEFKQIGPCPNDKD
ncbi:hypothetical protein [Paenibacillus xylaniclasticus]|uniref:hypothetical protein n=1 Tax=Paenibacillus xylaniclasticus TaxID=588083 RepID=UPI000FD94027|nr:MULTISPECIES: hypothetical protein [Paenibacillus]GFN31458.1 hypothetical protein PCURB6_17180 [Paenibacillus curdlanolyticus]